MSDENGNGNGNSIGEEPAPSTSMALARIRQAANLPADEWNDERISAIARTVAPREAKPAEIAMFLAVAHAYQLDPFLKEIYLGVQKGKVLLLTGRESFLKVSRRDPAYRGYRSGIVHAKDEFSVEHTDVGVKITHRINGFDRGEMVGAYCVVFKEGHPPVLVLRQWSDYKHLHEKDNWKNYAPDMLETRVITAAHRRAFSISGLYAPEEFVDGELDPEVDRDSARAHQGTRNKIEELKARMAEPVKAAAQPPVQEADFEIIQEAATPTPAAAAAAAEQGRAIRESVEADDPFKGSVTASTPLANVQFSGRARSALERVGITTVGQLLATTWTALENVLGLGSVGQREIQKFLSENNLKLADEPQFGRIGPRAAPAAAPPVHAPAPPAQPAPAAAPAETEEEEDDDAAAERGMRRFWAVYNEAGYAVNSVDQEKVRRGWLKQHFGQESLSRLSAFELNTAADLIRDGQGPARSAKNGAQRELEVAGSGKPPI